MPYDVTDLKIDEDFKRYILPLTPEEYVRLEESIKTIGCRNPLTVWNKSIIDGHNRYEICSRLNVPFTIKHIVLHTREQVIAWICANQLKRNNLTAEARWYLIGKRYNLERIIGAHKAAGTNKYVRKQLNARKLTEITYDDTPALTGARLGKEYSVNPVTVLRYGDYAQAIDTLSEVNPAFFSKIMNGHIKVLQKNIIRLSKLTHEEMVHISSDLLTGKQTSQYKDLLTSVEDKPIEKPALTFAVKDLPAYDPDAEVMSLTFTIPSWVSSIDRTRKGIILHEVSDEACSRLIEKLLYLKDEVLRMLTTLEEENNARSSSVYSTGTF